VRRLLALTCVTAVGLVAALTGCGSDSGGGAGTTTGEVTSSTTGTGGETETSYDPYGGG
jgi:ABC-type glycerol-3-phosphate transport system substrate-binding protein